MSYYSEKIWQDKKLIQLWCIAECLNDHLHNYICSLVSLIYNAYQKLSKYQNIRHLNGQLINQSCMNIENDSV